MTRPFRLLTTLALLTTSSLGLAGCGGGGQGIDEEIDSGGYAPGAEAEAVEPAPSAEATAAEPVPVDVEPAPVEPAEPIP